MTELSWLPGTLRTETHSKEKDNYDRLISVFHAGTDVKRCLLDFFLRKKHLDLLDWLTNISKSFLQFEDVKNARRKSSIIQATDLGLNTIDTVLKYNCFDMFWDCCLLYSSLEDILNSHKDELYRIYLNSKREHMCSPCLTKDQWEVLYHTEASEVIGEHQNTENVFASKGVTVSCLDSKLNFIILNIVCSLFKSVNAISECQVHISKFAVQICEIKNDVFDDLWEKMVTNILLISRHCQLYDHFRIKCEVTKCSRFNRIVVQDNRKIILEEAFNNPVFIDEKIFCECVQKELHLIELEENFHFAKRLCEREVCVNLDGGQYSKGAYTKCAVENAEKDLQLRKSVCSTKIQDDKQNDKEEKTEKDDIQERCNKHNYLKLVQLITCIAKDVLVDVLKRRLPALDFGQAFNGMKTKIDPLLSNNERQLLYPDNSKYSGDLTDLDISLLYIILRNVNTICPHKNGWGNNPDDDDESLSANIDRIRTFKNKYVSHFAQCSLNEIEFPKKWEEISQCIVQIGGTIYNQRIDFLLTSEINPVIERELCAAIEALKKSEIEKERMNIRLEEKLDSLTKEINMFSKQCMNKPIVSETQGRFPLTLKMSGDNIPLIEDIKPADFTNDDRRINYLKEGSLIIGFEVSPKVLESVGYFLNIIDALIFDLLQTCPIPVVDRANQVIISIEFIGWNSCCWSVDHDYDWTSTSYRSTSHDKESSSISCSKICKRYIDAVYSARYYPRQQLLTQIPEIIATTDISIQNKEVTSTDIMMKPAIGEHRMLEQRKIINKDILEPKINRDEQINLQIIEERDIKYSKAEAPKRKFYSIEMDSDNSDEESMIVSGSMSKNLQKRWKEDSDNSDEKSMIVSGSMSKNLQKRWKENEAIKRKYHSMKKNVDNMFEEIIRDSEIMSKSLQESTEKAEAKKRRFDSMKKDFDRIDTGKRAWDNDNSQEEFRRESTEAMKRRYDSIRKDNDNSDEERRRESDNDNSDEERRRESPEAMKRSYDSIQKMMAMDKRIFDSKQKDIANMVKENMRESKRLSKILQESTKKESLSKMLQESTKKLKEAERRLENLEKMMAMDKRIFDSKQKTTGGVIVQEVSKKAKLTEEYDEKHE